MPYVYRFRSSVSVSVSVIVPIIRVALPFRSAVAVFVPCTERIRKQLHSILFERMNGNGKLTETENVIFYESYGILTDERNSYVFLKRNTRDTVTDKRKRNAENQA